MKILLKLKWIFLIFIIINCKEQNTKEVDIKLKVENTTNNPVMTESKLPYSSDEVKKYYKCDLGASNCSVVAIPDHKLMSFTPEELSLPIKENDFEITPAIENKYLEIEKFTFQNNISGSLIIYNTNGDNNSKILNVQLKSYKNGQLSDQLLLDSRFTFEVGYYRTFMIRKDEKIEIVKHSVNSLRLMKKGILSERKKSLI